MEHNALSRTTLVLVCIAAGFFVATATWRILGFLFDVLMIVFFAWMVANVVNHVAASLQKRVKLKEKPSIGLAYLLVFGPAVLIFTIAIPIIVSQAFALPDLIPEVVERLPEVLESAESAVAAVGVDLDLSGYYNEDLPARVEIEVRGWFSRNGIGVAKTSLTTLFNVFIVATMSFYMVSDERRLADAFFRVTPPAWHSDAGYVFRTMDNIFFKWLSGVLIIGSVFAACTFVVLTIAGSPNALPVAFIAGALVVVPLFGDLLAIGLAVLVTLSTGSVGSAVVVGAVLAFIDVVPINLFISPRVVSNAVKLPIVLVVISVLVGNAAVGPVGGLLGVPVAALLYASTIAFSDRAHGRTMELRAHMSCRPLTIEGLYSFLRIGRSATCPPGLSTWASSGFSEASGRSR